MSEDAKLGFEIDTSPLDATAKAFQGVENAAKGATDAADKFTSSLSNGGISRYSFLNSKTAQQLEREVASSGEAAGKGWYSNFVNGIKNNHAAQRELGVMSHEIMSGNISRLRGSASIFLSNAGLGGLAGTGLVMGISALTEGIDALVESMQEAAQVRDDLNDAAINSGNVGAFYQGQLDNIIDKIKVVGDMSKEAKEKMISTALNAGLSPDFIQGHMDTIAGYYNSMGEKNSEAMDKILAETQTDATKGYKMLSTMGGAFLDKVNDDISSGKYQQAGADMISGLIDGMDKAARAKENLSGKLKGNSWWEDAEFYMGVGSFGYSSQGIQTQQKIINVHNQHINFVKQQADKAQAEKQQYITDLGKKKDDLSDTAAFHNFDKFYHKTFTHHGLTAAQRAAKHAANEAAQWAASMDSFNQNIVQSSKNRLSSLNRSFDNSTYKYFMSGDQHNLLNQIQQESDYINNQINNLNERYMRARKPHDAAYDTALASIRAGGAEYVKQVQDNYDKIQSYQSSALKGMDAGWQKYQSTVNDVASQSENVFSTACTDMTDSLTDFFTTGESGWQNYLKSIATMIEKYMVQDWIVSPVMGWAKGGIDSLFASPSQNVASDAAAMVPVVGGVGATRKMGLGASNWAATAPIQVIVNNNGGSDVKTSTQADTKKAQDLARQLAKTAANFVRQENVNSNRSGGINNTMGNWKTS